MAASSSRGISQAINGQVSNLSPTAAALDQCVALIKQIISKVPLEGALSEPPVYALQGFNKRLIGSLQDTHSDLYKLSMYQIQDGKIEEAIKTLRKCNAAPLVASLSLQLSPDNVTWVMDTAAICTPEDQIFIYKQILSFVPNNLDVYTRLIPLIKDPKEKQELLLKAAALGVTIVEQKVITKEAWASPQTTALPPYPQKLKDFLEGDCTIWPGKKIKETHIVVPLFPEVNINGSPEPFTLASLDRLDKSTGGPGYRYIWDKIPNNIPAEKEFHYAVLTKDVIPGTRNKSFEEQKRLLPAGYEVPPLLGAATAILWENRRANQRYFTVDPWAFMRCLENVDSYPVVVGGFAPAGLYVSNCSLADEYIGVAGWRKF